MYDCFMGSGTTAKMAHVYKRNWIGSELSKEYLKDAENRLNEAQKRLTEAQKQLQALITKWNALKVKQNGL